MGTLIPYGPYGGSTPLLSSPSIGLSPFIGGGMGRIGGYGGFGPYGGFGGYMDPYPFDINSYLDPWGYLDDSALEQALRMGQISGPQYTQIILILGDGRRRRSSLFPCFGRRDAYMKMMMGGGGGMMGGGFGFGRLGRLNRFAGGLIPGRWSPVDWW